MLRILFVVAVTTTSAQANTCSAIPNVDFEGNDISTTDRANPGKCCGDCQATPGCTAFNWYDGVCFLKSAQGASLSLPGGVSGVVLKATPAPTTTPAKTTPTPKPTPKPSPKPSPKPTCKRIRKSWEALTAAEKNTYISAIELAMDRGLYHKFVEIHKETMSTTEAHNSCVFLFWHRKLLLAYENMLRSLGNRYKCLTLPYWDYVQNYATMQNTPRAKRCRSIEECSPVLGDIGGSTVGKRSTKNLFGYSYPALTCVTNRPANHLCTVAGASSSTCDHCIPRGNWASIPMITDMSIDSVRGQLLAPEVAGSIRLLSQAIESSPHASIHITLSGPQNNVAVSPMDPVFFIHHNTLDLLHTIYYHCKVEPLGLSKAEKMTDTRSFQGCTTGNGHNLGPTSPIMMKLEGPAGVVNIENDPLVGEFFRDLPNQYYQFADVRSLGYSYELKGLLGDLYSKCDGTMAVSRLESFSENVTSPFDVEHEVQPVVLEENLNALSFQDAVLAQAKKQGMTIDQGFHELRKMTVMLQQNCLTGDVTDFTDDQKATFHVTMSPSFAILTNIRNGQDPIRIERWTELLFKYYGCHGDVKEQ
ncbi:hypothetical protein B5M09_012251 [Aphanomyces astaci]|nr:hypothetical protein B5M09_012251 [Aphanomyces astaci]